MGVPAFVSVGAFALATGAAALTPNLPASIAANNILLSFISIQGTGRSPTIATPGWTVGDSVNTGNNTSAWAWAIALGGGLDVAAAWTWTGGTASCCGQEIQYSGNSVVAPINTNNQATANASTSITIGSLTTTADNCLILDFLTTANSQVIPVPASYTSRGTGNTPEGSIRFADASIGVAGTTDAQSIAITSANWSSFGIAILGSGSGTLVAEHASQVVQSTLEDYSDPTVAHASQVIQTALEVYSDPTFVHASQVVIAVLRSVNTAQPHVRFNMPMMGR